MNTDILEDLKETVATMKERYGFEVVEMHVGMNYAGFLRASLAERGVEIDEPEAGDEVNLSFTSGHKVRLLVH